MKTREEFEALGQTREEITESLVAMGFVVPSALSSAIGCPLQQFVGARRAGVHYEMGLVRPKNLFALKDFIYWNDSQVVRHPVAE